ncbi:hypothetical protein FQA39_LY18455 [Lamprigera yunnana]|nr:hypothetical protein FQA39_LY18455 [Lamprigera yunnana]
MDSLDLKVLCSILLLLWLEFVWELYLEIRQFRLCKKTKEVPTDIQHIMPKETFDKARMYALSKHKFSFVKTSFSILLTTYTLHCGLLETVWTYSISISSWEGEVAPSCIWMALLTTLMMIIDLPFTIYYTFILEETYGFNKQTAKFFIWDNIKNYFLFQCLSLPICSVIILVVKYGGDWFFVWLWLVVCIIMLALLTIYPVWIAPLFDKFEPLPEGELRMEIEKLATLLKFPLKQVYVVEGSKRSAHSNAYFTGFWGGKRIVLFDTLLAKPDSGGCNTEEVLAILAHELGHWKHSHLIKNIIISQINLLLIFAVFSTMLRYPPIYRAVGFDVDVQPVLVGLLVVSQYILLPYNALISFFHACISRRFEFESDKFAKKLGRAEPLKTGLIQLYKDNLGFPVHDPIYSAWYHSHPTLLQRLDALK